jgi:hypothetical protein
LKAEPPASPGVPAARGGPVVPSGGWDVAALLAWFEPHGRRHLPWREEPTPYRVIVSEFMLQQTQVERVLPIFERFVAAFPSFGALAGNRWKFQTKVRAVHDAAHVRIERGDALIERESEDGAGGVRPDSRKCEERRFFPRQFAPEAIAHGKRELV